MRSLAMVKLTQSIAARADTATSTAVAVMLAIVLGVDCTVTAANRGSWAFELATGLVMYALALLRSRARVLTAAVGLGVGGIAAVTGDMLHFSSQPGVAGVSGLLVLGAAAVRVAPSRSVTILALAGCAVMVAGRVTLRFEYALGFSFLALLAWGLALGIGIWLRLLDVRRQMAIDAARRDERLQMARELHDVVAHHVAGIVIQAQAAGLIAAEQPETVKGTMAEIESAGNDALAAMRHVVSLLRDGDDAPGRGTGPSQLSELIDRFAGHGPPVHARLPDQTRRWPPEVATTVYRIVQEALTNVVLHAPGAAGVQVLVEDDHRAVTVQVIDDGPARSAGSPRLAPSGGHGLIGMRERIEALGGTLDAGPDTNGRWAVRAVVPLNGPSAT